MTYSFCKFFLLSAFYNCNIIILYLCLSFKFCLSNSSQIDINSFLTPIFRAALLVITTSNISTSAMESHGKVTTGTEGIKPLPVYRSFSSQICFNICFHSQLLLAFGFVSLSSLSLRHLLKALFLHNYHNPMVKILSSGVVATISSYNPGVPAYFF